MSKTPSPGRRSFSSTPGRSTAWRRKDRLVQAGIRPEGKAVYELANGEPVEYEYGFARITFLGAETVAQIIFGPPETEPILGVVALENTGVTVDPVTKTLRRMHAKPLK